VNASGKPTPDEVEVHLGADRASRRSLTFEQAADEQDFVAERFAVRIGVLDEWTVIVEPNGYICSQDAVLTGFVDRGSGGDGVLERGTWTPGSATHERGRL
jgi:hypothetical protein